MPTYQVSSLIPLISACILFSVHILQLSHNGNDHLELCTCSWPDSQCLMTFFSYFIAQFWYDCSFLLFHLNLFPCVILFRLETDSVLLFLATQPGHFAHIHCHTDSPILLNCYGHELWNQKGLNLSSAISRVSLDIIKTLVSLSFHT